MVQWRDRLRHARSFELRHNEGVSLLGVDAGGNAYVCEGYYQMDIFEHLKVSPEGEILDSIRHDVVERENLSVERNSIPFTVEGPIFPTRSTRTPFPFIIDTRGRRTSVVEGASGPAKPFFPVSATEEAEIRGFLSKMYGPAGQPDQVLGRDQDIVFSEVPLGPDGHLITRSTSVITSRKPEHVTIDLAGARWWWYRLVVTRLQFVVASEDIYETLPYGKGTGEFGAPREIIDAGDRIYVADSGYYEGCADRLHVLEKV